MLRRFPNPQSILQVYAVIAVLLSGWTITAFLWRLSAWLLLLNLGEIFTIFSYALAANFLESLLILLSLLIAAALLPAHLLREDFVVRGAILALGSILVLMTFVGSHMVFGVKAGIGLYIAPVVAIGATALLLGMAARWRSAVISFSDRLVVFLFVLIPLFVISSIHVMFRNLGG